MSELARLPQNLEAAAGEGSSAVDGLLAEVRVSLEFGTAHVALIGDRATTPELRRRLAEGLGGEIETVTVHLTGREESVERAVEAAIGDARRTTAAPDEDAPAHAPQRAKVALLIPDALSIPRDVLRTLNEATRVRGMCWRLVLCVDRDATPIEDPAAELATRIGEGVSKIELPRPRSELSFDREAAALESNLPATLLPPVVCDEHARRVRPIAVRSRRSRARTRLRWMTLTAIAAGAVVATQATLREPGAPSIVARADALPETFRSVGLGRPMQEEEQPELPQQVSNADAVPAGEAPNPPQMRPAEAPSLPSPRQAVARSKAAPSIERTAPSPEPQVSVAEVVEVEERVRAPEPAPVAAPSPVAVKRVPVSFNATPWAKLEIDGKSVGPTPIANIRLTPGEHEIRATFPDGRVDTQTVYVDALADRFRID